MKTITLSDDLVERLEARVQYTDFETVDEYAEFTLSEVVTRAERESDKTVDSAVPQDKVQDRLESLGYLNE